MNPKPPRPKPIQQKLFDLENDLQPVGQPIERPFSLGSIFLGTSSFTPSGWEGSFYPLGMRSKDFLRHYASQFQTVEIDSTFYGTPAGSTVTSWNEKTPRDFIFAVKVPQVITHEKVLADCEPEFDEFIERMHFLVKTLGTSRGEECRRRAGQQAKAVSRSAKRSRACHPIPPGAI